MKKIILFIFTLFIIIPFNVNAISDKYVDKVSNILNAKIDDNKINLYLFYGKECPHCEAERKWLEIIKEDYNKYINIYEYEVWHNEENKLLLDKVTQIFDTDSSSIPFMVIGDKYFVGYSETVASKIENTIKDYSNLKNNPNIIKLPLLGNINIKEVSIPIVAVILGFIDGFNPCAMWILLFLINMLFGMENKKKSWILGLTFLFVSGFIYFLSMLGINFIVDVAKVKLLKILIAIFILVAGIWNFNKFLKMRKKENGCTVVDAKKRKKIIKDIQKIVSSKSFVLAMFGISALAVSVNLIELACSLGFPLIFTEILSINKIYGFIKILYLLLYILFYMIDDIVVFSLSMFTLTATGITNKYSKACTLVSSVIMILMGILLIFKPEWLMMNFN